MLVWQFARRIPVFGGCRAGLGELLSDRLFPRVVADRLVRFSGLGELRNRSSAGCLPDHSEIGEWRGCRRPASVAMPAPRGIRPPLSTMTCPSFDSTLPRCVVASCQVLRKSVTAGLSSASFCCIASALRYSASASDDLPVSASRGEVVVADSQAAAEIGDGGVVVSQLLLIASAVRYSASASEACPIRQHDAEVVVAVRQAAAEVGDGGVIVGQLLLDRQRLAVFGLRFR